MGDTISERIEAAKKIVYPPEKRTSEIREKLPKELHEELEKWKRAMESGIYKTNMKTAYEHNLPEGWGLYANWYEREEEPAHGYIPRTTDVRFFEEGYEKKVGVRGEEDEATVYGEIVMTDYLSAGPGRDNRTEIRFLLTDKGIVTAGEVSIDRYRKIDPRPYNPYERIYKKIDKTFTTIYNTAFEPSDIGKNELSQAA